MRYRAPSRLEIVDGALVVSTPYDAALVSSIKKLPASERKYDPDKKVWMVDPKHTPSVALWIEYFIGDKVAIPEFKDRYESKIKQYLTVRYVGTCKARTDGTSSAFGLLGLAGTNWGVIFPEQVLRNYFDGGSLAAPTGQENYYSLLSISQGASEDEVKSGFRRMAKLWHPDHCKEETAAEVFMMVKTAFDVLSNSDSRARYDAGLLLEATMGFTLDTSFRSVNETSWGYRAPLRSGKILVEGLKKFSMIEATKICSWEDIVDGQGRTLIVSWPAGAKEPVEEWL